MEQVQTISRKSDPAPINLNASWTVVLEPPSLSSMVHEILVLGTEAPVLIPFTFAEVQKVLDGLKEGKEQRLELILAKMLHKA